MPGTSLLGGTPVSPWLGTILPASQAWAQCTPGTSLPGGARLEPAAQSVHAGNQPYMAEGLKGDILGVMAYQLTVCSNIKSTLAPGSASIVHVHTVDFT